jgi:hypothetical protein
MLVLQRRMDVAMDEIQELRVLVQTLQQELKNKTDQHEWDRVAALLGQEHEEGSNTPRGIQPSNIELEVGNAVSSSTDWTLRVTSHPLSKGQATAAVYILVVACSFILGGGILESVLCFMSVITNEAW